MPMSWQSAHHFSPKKNILNYCRDCIQFFWMHSWSSRCQASCLSTTVLMAKTVKSMTEYVTTPRRQTTQSLKVLKQRITSHKSHYSKHRIKSSNFTKRTIHRPSHPKQSRLHGQLYRICFLVFEMIAGWSCRVQSLLLQFTTMLDSEKHKTL